MLQQSTRSLRIQACKQGLHEITAEVSQWLDSQRIGSGLLTLFCAHTSASLVIQENAARAASHDLEAFFERIAPEEPGLYTHNDEGPDDMPAHIRSALLPTQLSIPVQGGKMMLGRWQGIFLFEHRREPPFRRIVLYLIGEAS
jgi:secondary thiamine-phosphate synthase enzyme